MGKESKESADQEKDGRRSDAWYAAVVRDLDAYKAEQGRLWGDTDENLLAAYVSGVCTPEEIAKVEQAMRDYPAVRDLVKEVQKVIGPGTPPADGNPARTGRVWEALQMPAKKLKTCADKARRPEAEPESPDGKPPTGRTPGR